MVKNLENHKKIFEVLKNRYNALINSRFYGEGLHEAAKEYLKNSASCLVDKDVSRLYHLIAFYDYDRYSLPASYDMKKCRDYLYNGVVFLHDVSSGIFDKNFELLIDEMDDFYLKLPNGNMQNSSLTEEIYQNYFPEKNANMIINGCSVRKGLVLEDEELGDIILTSREVGIYENVNLYSELKTLYEGLGRGVGISRARKALSIRLSDITVYEGKSYICKVVELLKTFDDEGGKTIYMV